jgi:hypothetical protein
MIGMAKEDSSLRNVAIWVGLAFVVVLFFIGVGRHPSTDTPAAAPTQTQTILSDSSADRDRWDSVAKVFTDQGWSVNAFDPANPNLMSITVPSEQAMDLPEKQVKEMAGLAYQRLGADGSVFIDSAGGQELAHAGPLGVR